MHHDFDGMFGDSHDVGHHVSHLHDETDENQLPTSDTTHNQFHLLDLHDYGTDQQSLGASTDAHHLHGWHDENYVNHSPHLHLERHSEAADSNGDGISDAVSKDLGLDPFDTNAHHTVDLGWHDSNGRLHHTNGRDSDHDGWPDDLERLAGTDSRDAASHPSLVEAHHFPAGSDENLPGTADVTPQFQPWP